MNANKLKGKIIERGFTIDKLALLIGVSTPTLYKKLQNPGKLTIGEAILIKDILCLTNAEAREIFLKLEVA